MLRYLLIGEKNRTGERIDEKATIIGKLGSNWIAVFDAKYRAPRYWCNITKNMVSYCHVTKMPIDNYSTLLSADEILERNYQDMDSGEVNMSEFVTIGINDFPAANFCRGLNAGGRNAVLPNIQTLHYIFSRGYFIDQNDPTASISNYFYVTMQKSVDIKSFWSSTTLPGFSTGYAAALKYTSKNYDQVELTNSAVRTSALVTIPILEIPVFDGSNI